MNIAKNMEAIFVAIIAIAAATSMATAAVPKFRAAHALGDLQAATAIPMLHRYLDDTDPEVASEVRWALAEMRQ